MAIAWIASLCWVQTVAWQVEQPVEVKAAGGTVVIPTAAQAAANDRLCRAIAESSVAEFRIAVLRAKGSAEELGMSKAEIANLAIAATELEERDRTLLGLCQAGKYDEFRKDCEAREHRDRKLLVDAFGAERAQRIDQLALHFKGPRWSLLPALVPEFPFLVATPQDLKVKAALEITFDEFVAAREPTRRAYLGSKVELRERHLHMVRAKHDEEFLKALTPRQREAWLKLAGPKPKMPFPEMWPHLREPVL